MRRQLASLLITCGALLVLFGAGGWTGPAVVKAQSVAPQPSPRPPANLDGDDSRGDGIVPTGRVTGTVIDSLTGAPLPGVTVIVGDDLVTSDANGNYDHWLPVGSYNVLVAPDAARVAAAEPPVVVTVTTGGTTVQHLAVRSQPAQQAEAVPARAAAPSMEVNAAPTPVVQSVVVDAERPRSLPRTGLDGDGSSLWIAGGLALLLIGALVWGRPVARLAPALGRGTRLPADFDGSALLAGLLGARTERDELLEELLARDKTER